MGRPTPTRSGGWPPAFLVGCPDSTAKAYLGDLKAWAAECECKGVHPFATRRHHVDAWVKALAREPSAATGRPAAAATIARRLSCLSKFYVLFNSARLP